jgi:hypothetical protein
MPRTKVALVAPLTASVVHRRRLHVLRSVLSYSSRNSGAALRRGAEERDVHVVVVVTCARAELLRLFVTYNP